MNINRIEIVKTTVGYYGAIYLTIVRGGEAKSIYIRIVNKRNLRHLQTYKHIFPLVVKIWWTIMIYKFNLEKKPCTNEKLKEAKKSQN